MNRSGGNPLRTLGRWTAGSAIFFATVFAWIVGAVVLLVAAFTLLAGFASKTRLAIGGPAGGKHSTFVEMTEREMEFMVSDRPWKWKPVSLGTLSTENPQALEGFCWSADGSVIARASGEGEALSQSGKAGSIQGA